MIPALTNPTLETFLSPETFIGATDHWVIVLRNKQVTLGSLILITKHNVNAMADLPADAVTDLHNAWQKIARLYDATFQPEKLNYLALMMVDTNPHFHVLPRYAAPRAFDGAFFDDKSWPKPPDLAQDTGLTPAQHAKLAEHLRAAI